MPGQPTCAPSVVTLPARLDAAAAEQAAGQITAAFTPGVSVVIADLTAAAYCDRAAIRNLLKAHRQAAARGGQVRFAIRPDGPLHQLTGFAGTHPLLAVYPTLQHALTGQSPLPAGNRAAPCGQDQPGAAQHVTGVPGEQLHSSQGEAAPGQVNRPGGSDHTQRSFAACTAACTRFRAPSLRRISWMCDFTVFSLR